jgi:O-antigen/teichoic acid export membrane protein
LVDYFSGQSMMPRLRKVTLFSFGDSRFFRNTLQLVWGTGIAQAISIVASPFLTRIYSPDDFGQFTFFISIAAAFTLIATLRYELAIIYAKDIKEAVNVLWLSFVICAGISFLLLILVLVYRFFFEGSIPINPVLKQWLIFLPLLVFTLGSGNILQNWFIRKKEYKLISSDKVLNSSVNNMTSISLGLLHIGAWGLLIGNMAGALLFVLFLLIFSFLKKHWNISEFKRGTVMTMARKYKDLPTSNTLQAISEMLQNYGVIYLTRIFFSTSIVGMYALSMRILQAPLWLLGNSILQVYFKDASEQYNKNQDIRDLLSKTIKLSALVALPIMILLIVGGPWIFSSLFGQSWREAGIFSRILAPWMFFDFIRYTISQTPMLLGRVRSMFLISLAGNGLMIISLVIGGLLLKDVRMGFITLSLLMSIYATGVIFWIYRLTIHKKENDTPEGCY